MKTLKKDPCADVEHRIITNIGQANFNSLMCSFATMADTMARYLMDEFKSKDRVIPPAVLYAVAQTGAYLSMIAMAIHEPERLKDAKFLHIAPYDVIANKDAERRFIWIIGEFYKHLKEEGKL